MYIHEDWFGELVKKEWKRLIAGRKTKYQDWQLRGMKTHDVIYLIRKHLPDSVFSLIDYEGDESTNTMRKKIKNARTGIFEELGRNDGTGTEHRTETVSDRPLPVGSDGVEGLRPVHLQDLFNDC